MTKQIEPWRQLHTSRHFNDRESHGLWRDATRRPAGVGTAARCGRCGRRPARSGRGRCEPYRYQRLLRSACDQSDHQAGASSLSGWPGDRHQGGRPPRCGQVLDSCSFAAGTDRCAFTTICEISGLDALDVVNLRVGGVHGAVGGIDRRTADRACRAQAPGTDPSSRSEQRQSRRSWRRRRRLQRSSACRTSTTWRTGHDDGFIDDLAAQGIAYVPFFPLGGFTPLQSSALDAVAASLEATPMQVALAWLLQRSPNILLIPGTSSVAHLRENLNAATLQFPPETIATLDAIAIGAGQ